MHRSKFALSLVAAVAVAFAGTRSSAQSLTVLGNAPGPNAGLTLSPDGTTFYGTNQELDNGPGNVFSIPVSGGPVTVLGTFNGTNGYNPSGDLTLSGSTLYGTASYGGAYGEQFGGYGTVFSIPTSGGAPTVLTSFNNTDGANPFGSLTLIGSTFYGMTEAGGADNKGTIFSIPLAGGAPTVLASFDGTHGEYPTGNLTLIGSTLYGMTQYGGADNDGVVFSIPLIGGFPTVLATLTSGLDGVVPLGNVELSGGNLTLSANGSTLYGATIEGGAGDGNIFSVPLAGGTPTTLYNFTSADNNGLAPTGDMTLIGSKLYGMTNTSGPGEGPGKIFALQLVPEPSSAILLGLGAIGFAAAAAGRKLRRRAA